MMSAIKLILSARGNANLFAFLLICGFAFGTPASGQPSRNRNAFQIVQDKHRDRFREFSEQIAKLADNCEAKGQDDAVIQIRSRMFTPDSHALRVKKLPTEARPEIPANISAEERLWRTRLRSLETTYAKDLYILSRQALIQGYPSYAYNLIREAALHDSDHQQVRRILGFVRLGNEWVTPFANSQIRQGNVWNDRFGWLPKSHEAKYEKGERFYNNRWISAEKELELRRDFQSAWKIQTDHYLVKTNVSLERGVEFAKALEDFQEVFKETFAGFFHTSEQLKKLFDGNGKAARGEGKPYTVHFYRTREEYLEKLRKFFPSIDQTNGVYLTNDRVAHFYLDPDQDNAGTLFHEATHQLFYESDSSDRTICELNHFWIIEGIACYMESFHQKDGTFSLGDPEHQRFRGARHNLLNENYYVPLRTFSGYGMQEFQNAPKNELVKNYTQASGLARFFMHYDEGRYREALVQQLVELYSTDKRVRENAQGLDQLTGVEFSELDRQYREDALENN